MMIASRGAAGRASVLPARAVQHSPRGLCRPRLTARARSDDDYPTDTGVVVESERGPIRYSVHGRHVDVDDRLQNMVIQRLNPVVGKMNSPEYVESAGGGVSLVDVRLMNTSAEIRVQPVMVDKSSHALHDTFVRQGEIIAQSQGDSVYDSFEKAVTQLEKKLKPQTKPAPRKVNYRTFTNSGRSNPTGGR